MPPEVPKTWARLKDDDDDDDIRTVLLCVDTPPPHSSDNECYNGFQSYTVWRTDVDYCGIRRRKRDSE